MLSETIIAIIRAEMGRHKFDTYIGKPPSIAKGVWLFQAAQSVRCD